MRGGGKSNKAYCWLFRLSVLPYDSVDKSDILGRLSNGTVTTTVEV